MYGISEIQELNKLFTFLAYNTGNEASLENISKESGLAKPTIKKYIEYLELAFLIIKVSNVDQNCRSMTRERNFKIYLNNPSMRAALFSPVSAENSNLLGHLAESAIFSQWQHSPGTTTLRYARWKNEGEVDIVNLMPGQQRPQWAVEIKWSDRAAGKSSEIKGLLSFCRLHGLSNASCTTKTVRRSELVNNVALNFVPTALYCYMVGRNITSFVTDPANAKLLRPAEFFSYAEESDGQADEEPEFAFDQDAME